MAQWPTAESLGLEVGQRRALRLGSLDEDKVTEVEVRRIGVNRPPRVLVEFCDDEYEGRREWVAPNRIAVPWSESRGWVARQRAFRCVAELSADADVVEARAAWDVLGLALDIGQDIREVTLSAERVSTHNPARSMAVRAPDALGQSLASRLRELDGAFTDDDGWLVVPWPGPVLLAQALSEKLGEDEIAELIDERRESELEVASGSEEPERWLDGWSLADIARLQFDSANLALSWCDSELVGTRDEMAALRATVAELQEERRRLAKSLLMAQQGQLRRSEYKRTLELLGFNERALEYVKPLHES